LSTRPTLVIDVVRIPPEGMDVNCPLDPGEVHVQGEEGFTLEAGGHIVCRIEKGDDETVHVKGRVAVRLGLECGRCLEAFSLPLDHGLDLFYLPHQPGEETEDEEEISERDLVVAYYREGRLDLGEIVREQIFLTLPMKRLCSEGCLGLCPVCGTNRNTAPCVCPRSDFSLSPLAKLFEKGSSS
jgi:uncharacterized protein